MRELFTVIFVLLATCSGEDCETAKRWGFICLDGDTTAVCVFDGTKFTEIGRTECGPGTYCNEDTRNCTLNYAERFQCYSPGFYPDLGNCRKYVYCAETNSDAQSLNCPAGKMFSPTTGCCSQEYSEASCSRRRVTCQAGGKVAVWPENNNYFYSCVKTLPSNLWYPQLIKCPGNQTFNGFQCVERGSSTNPSLPSSPSSDSESCNPGSFATSDENCRQYLYCNANRVWVSYSCGTNAIFDLASKRCRLGSC